MHAICKNTWCRKSFTPKNAHHVFHHPRCRMVAQSTRRYSLAYHQARLKKKQTPTGRTCRWPSCQAQDHLVRFRLSDECEVCQKRRSYHGACGKCKGPRHVSRHGDGGKSEGLRCPTCDPPPAGTLEVIVLEKGSDREKRVWRAPFYGKVRVGTKYQLITAIPMVVTLEPEAWVRVRS